MRVELKYDDNQIRRFLSAFADKSKWSRVLKTLVATIGFKNVIKHFEDSEGPKGGWPKRKESTQKYYAQRSKRSAVFNPSNQLLVLTGNLRKNFRVSNIRQKTDSVELFNPVKYAHRHDEGTEGMPKRQFMWLDDNAQKLISKGFWTMVGEQQGLREFD